MASSRSCSVSPSAAATAGDLGQQHGRRDAVLVERPRARRGSRAPARSRTRTAARGRSRIVRPIHLNPVNVSAKCTPCRPRPSSPSSDDDTSVVITSRSSPVVLAQDVVGEQPPDLVAAEPPPRPVGLRDRRAEPVGVGVVGDGHVGAVLGRPASSSEVHRPRLLRVRERHGRERRGRAAAARPRRPARSKPGAVERPQQHRRRRRRASACRRPARRRPRAGRRTAGMRVEVARRRTSVVEVLDQRIVLVGQRRPSAGRRASMHAAICRSSCGGTICGPSPRYTL